MFAAVWEWNEANWLAVVFVYAFRKDVAFQDQRPVDS